MDQDAAILRLLSDDDEATVRLVIAKLTEVKSLAELRRLQARATGVAAARLETLALRTAQHEADAAFATACAGVKEQEDLEEANWLLAATFAPGRDFGPPRRLLDEWGIELALRLDGLYTAADKVDTMAQYLGRELRLRGNDAEYYSIGNSLLPQVIESRLGIPISLSLIYMAVGRRARLEIEGVGLPGRFVARHRDILFDPFHGGRRLGLDECAALLRQQNLTLTSQHLATATPRQMLLRALTNLYYIAEQSDPALAAKLSRWAETLK